MCGTLQSHTKMLPSFGMITVISKFKMPFPIQNNEILYKHHPNFYLPLSQYCFPHSYERVDNPEGYSSG